MISPSACLSRFVHQQNKKSHQQPSICFFLYFAGLRVCALSVCVFFSWSQSKQDGFSRDFGGILHDSLSAAALTPTGDTASHPETSHWCSTLPPPLVHSQVTWRATGMDVYFNFLFDPFCCGLAMKAYIIESKKDIGNCPHPLPRGWADTHLAAYLGVHGPVEDLAVTDPDDGGSWLGVVGMAGEVEGVAGPQADHWATADDRVLRRNWKNSRRGTGGQLVDDRWINPRHQWSCLEKLNVFKRNDFS